MLNQKRRELRVKETNSTRHRRNLRKNREQIGQFRERYERNEDQIGFKERRYWWGTKVQFILFCEKKIWKKRKRKIKRKDAWVTKYKTKLGTINQKKKTEDVVCYRCRQICHISLGCRVRTDQFRHLNKQSSMLRDES